MGPGGKRLFLKGGRIPMSPCAKKGDLNEAGVVFFHILLFESCPGSGPRKKT